MQRMPPALRFNGLNPLFCFLIVIFLCYPIEVMANKEKMCDIEYANIQQKYMLDLDEPTIKQLEIAADDGNVEALLKLGYYLYWEDDVDVIPKAIGYFRRAASQGDLIAMIALANIFDPYDGYQPDKEMFEYYLNQAADAGCIEAILQLGAYYIDSERGNDFKQGVSNYELLLANKNSRAALELADAYANEKKPFFDANLANQYYTLAAEWGDYHTRLEIGEAFFHGDKLPNHYQQALNYFEKAEFNEDKIALFYVAKIYLKGLSGTVDVSKAIKLFEKSAQLGDNDSAFELGYIYYKGAYGFKEDYDLAMHYFELSAKLGDANALNSIGYMYEQGIGREQNSETAFYYYRLAANKNYAPAQYTVSLMYADKDSQFYDLDRAIYYAKEAYEQGNIDAAFQIAHLYELINEHQLSLEWQKTACELEYRDGCSRTKNSTR